MCRLLLGPPQHDSPVVLLSAYTKTIHPRILSVHNCDSTAAKSLLTQQQGLAIHCAVNATWVPHEVDVMWCAGALMASSGSSGSSATPTNTPIITSSIAGAPSPEPVTTGLATPGALNTTLPAAATSGRKMLQS